MSQQLDPEDLYKFAKEQFGIRPTRMQLEMIKHVVEGKQVTVMYFHRATGKTTAVKLAKAYKEYLEKQACPNYKNHTKQPEGYLAWHEWAEKKSKTHHQVKCDGCGLFAIWKKNY